MKRKRTVVGKAAAATSESDFERQVSGIMERFVRRMTPSLDDRGALETNESNTAPLDLLDPRYVRGTLTEATDQFQRAFVLARMKQHRTGERWNLSAAARALGITRPRLYRLLRKFGVADEQVYLSRRKDR